MNCDIVIAKVYEVFVIFRGVALKTHGATYLLNNLSLNEDIIKR